MSNKLVTLLSAVIALVFSAVGVNYILQDNGESRIIDTKTKKLDSKYEVLSKIETKSTIENVSNQVVSAPTSTYTAKVSSVNSNSSITGDKEQWLSESGIPKSDWQYVDYIVTKESHWNPCAYNPGQSDCSANPTTACGLAQALPCGKQSKYGNWNDPVANLKWQYDYVRGAYGGYAQAYAYWQVHGNY